MKKILSLLLIVMSLQNLHADNDDLIIKGILTQLDALNRQLDNYKIEYDYNIEWPKQYKDQLKEKLNLLISDDGVSHIKTLDSSGNIISPSQQELMGAIDSLKKQIDAPAQVTLNYKFIKSGLEYYLEKNGSIENENKESSSIGKTIEYNSQKLNILRIYNKSEVDIDAPKAHPDISDNWEDVVYDAGRTSIFEVVMKYSPTIERKNGVIHIFGKQSVNMPLRGPAVETVDLIVDEKQIRPISIVCRVTVGGQTYQTYSKEWTYSEEPKANYPSWMPIKVVELNAENSLGVPTKILTYKMNSFDFDANFNLDEVKQIPKEYKIYDRILDRYVNEISSSEN